jgi:ligand-binding SRPBCC domain-containing protein
MHAGQHILRSETFVPRPRDETFAFFAAAENLERITPPELRFVIGTPLPITMAQGGLIEYHLRLFRIPFRWTSVISEWDPPHYFVDEQLKGPYSVWVHAHSFEEAPGGTRVLDEVTYRLPLYPLGELAYPLVRRQLQRIFAYRALRLEQLLDSGSQ